MNRRFALLTSLFVVSACSQKPDFLQVVSEFEARKNGGNLESVLELFTENASLDFGPLGTITGLDEIRSIHEYDLALRTQLNFEQCEAVGSEVTCRVVETNDWLKTANIKSITYDEIVFSFTADGHIESVTATLSSEVAFMLGFVLADFDLWAKDNEPGRYGELFSEDGAFVYSYENGEKVLALLRRWRGN